SARTLAPLPLPPLPAVCGCDDPWNTGSLFSASGISVGVVACSCSTETTVNGVGELAISEITREPVTTTCSTCPLSPDRAWAHAPCEHIRARPAAPPQRNAFLSLDVMMSPRIDLF